MIKSQFNSQLFYWIIVVIISGLLLWNIYAVVTHFNVFSFIPITILSVLLVLIVTKHQYAKISIKIWSIVFLAISSGLQVLGKALKLLAIVIDGGNNNFVAPDVRELVTNIVTLIIGILLFVFANRTIDVKKEEFKSPDEILD